MALWAWRPRPQPDELLSSWLRRVALGNSTGLHTFCNANWPRVQIWNRDIDSLAPDAVVSRMAEGVGTSFETAVGTTLGAFEGTLFERLRRNCGTDWVLTLGIYHRVRRSHGLQWCPRCLATDAEPYYRRRWRLALASTCPRHGIVLADSCHECGTPGMPHRQADPYCDTCFADRREHPSIVADSQTLQLEQRLAELLAPDVTLHSDLEELHPIAYYRLIRQVFTTVAIGERSQALRDGIAGNWGGDPAPPSGRQLEQMRAVDRHRMMGLVARVVRGWPWLFVAHCADAGVWKSWAFGDRRDGKAPYAYAEVLERYLSYP